MDIIFFCSCTHIRRAFFRNVYRRLRFAKDKNPEYVATGTKAKKPAKVRGFKKCHFFTRLVNAHKKVPLTLTRSLSFSDYVTLR